MFHTIRYRGHHIHVSILGGVETIKMQISTPDGRFDLQTRNTYAGAQRAITKHVKANSADTANR